MWDYKKEVIRKLIHLLSLLYVAVYVLVAKLTSSHKLGVLSLVFLLAILLTIEYVRLEQKKDVPVLSFFWTFKRSKEKNSIGADVFFLLGIIICIAVFNYPIALAAILMTVFGDLVSALVGPYGRIMMPSLQYKTLEGTLAQFAVDLAIGFMVLGTVYWPVVIAMAFTATIVETYTSKIDDNLLIPIFAGLNGQIALMILVAL